MTLGPQVASRKDEKDGKCWHLTGSMICRPDTAHGPPRHSEGLLPSRLYHLLKVSRGSEQPLALFTAVGCPGEMPNALSLGNSGQPVTHPVKGPQRFISKPGWSMHSLSLLPQSLDLVKQDGASGA